MTWTSIGDPILLSTEWQYTEPITSGEFFRLNHQNPAYGALFAIAQVETVNDELHILDSQVLQIEKGISDIIHFPLPGCFTNRRLAIKRLPKQPTLEQEVRRLFLPGYLQSEEDQIRITYRSEWQIAIEVSDYVEPNITVDLDLIQAQLTVIDNKIDLAPINTKLDTIDSKISSLQSSGSSGGTTQPSNQKTLAFVSNGDTNGVCYWIGTNYGGTQTWSNPHTAGRVVVTMSTVSNGNPNLLVNRAGGENNHTQNIANSWIAIDLGTGNTLIPNYYTLQSRGVYPFELPRNWKLQGSNNAASNSVTNLNNATWVDLDTRSNNTALSNTDVWAGFAVSGVTTGYRWLRILQNGKDSSGTDTLALGEFEFYGTFTRT